MGNSTSSTPLPILPTQINYAQSAMFKQIVAQAGHEWRVAIPAIVQSFNPTAQTVVAQIAIRELVRTQTGTEWTAIAPIQDVPLIFPSGGGWSLTFPVAAGDEGFLVFCDMCIDLWWSRGGVQDQFETRRHALSDCGFIPGGKSQPNVLANYSTASAQLRSADGMVIIDLASTGITITAPKVQITTNDGPVNINASSQVNLNQSNVNVNVGNLPTFPNNAAALLGGLVIGDLYRNGDALNVVH